MISTLSWHLKIQICQTNIISIPTDISGQLDNSYSKYFHIPILQKRARISIKICLISIIILIILDHILFETMGLPQGQFFHLLKKTIFLNTIMAHERVCYFYHRTIIGFVNSSLKNQPYYRAWLRTKAKTFFLFLKCLQNNFFLCNQ